jgi:hypothetical protein
MSRRRSTKKSKEEARAKEPETGTCVVLELVKQTILDDDRRKGQGEMEILRFALKKPGSPFRV